MLVLSVVVLSAARRIRERVTSPMMSDTTLRALGASSILVTALCSEILFLLWHQVEGSRKLVVDNGWVGPRLPAVPAPSQRPGLG